MSVRTRQHETNEVRRHTSCGRVAMLVAQVVRRALFFESRLLACSAHTNFVYAYLFFFFRRAMRCEGVYATNAA